MPGEPVSKAFKAGVDAVIYGAVRDFGGSISAEHGIGSAKTAWLEHSRTSGEIEMMRRIKQALDPDALMNPGKVIGSMPRPIPAG